MLHYPEGTHQPSYPHISRRHSLAIIAMIYGGHSIAFLAASSIGHFLSVILSICSRPLTLLYSSTPVVFSSGDTPKPASLNHSISSMWWFITAQWPQTTHHLSLVCHLFTYNKLLRTSSTAFYVTSTIHSSTYQTLTFSYAGYTEYRTICFWVKPHTNGKKSRPAWCDYRPTA